MLGAYCREHVAPAAPPPLLIEQGQEVGRVRVWVERRDGAWHVRVGGTVCVVREMAIEVPG